MSSETKKKYQRFRYTQRNLEDALEVVRSNQKSISGTAKEFNIPKSTFINKLRGSVPLERKMGPSTVLLLCEEERIKNWILAKAKLGFPMHPEEVKNTVQKILEVTGRLNLFNNNRPGRKWFNLFLKRHPDIVLKNTEVISKARAAVTEKGIQKWFSELKEYLKQENAENIIHDPHRIYNLDETGVQICPKTGKVLGEKGEKNNYVVASGQEKQSITVLCCYAASGEVIDPMIVYPYQRIPRDVMATVPDNIAVGRSPTGWMISATFYEYMADVFYKRLVEREVKFLVLMLLDGHKSHISMELHNFCVEKKILLVCLLPNATHIIQPCNVGIFRPLKLQWKKVVLQHQQKSTKPITKVNFAPLFYEAHSKTLKSVTIQKAFEACGLYPFNPDKVNYLKCISTRRQKIDELLSTSHDIASKNLEQEENSSVKVLKDIEAQIPRNVMQIFLEAYRLNEESSIEKVLYSIWKNLKNNSEGQIDSGETSIINQDEVNENKNSSTKYSFEN